VDQRALCNELARSTQQREMIVINVCLAWHPELSFYRRAQLRPYQFQVSIGGLSMKQPSALPRRSRLAMFAPVSSFTTRDTVIAV